jgi:hypothetical protein
VRPDGRITGSVHTGCAKCTLTTATSTINNAQACTRAAAPHANDRRREGLRGEPDGSIDVSSAPSRVAPVRCVGDRDASSSLAECHPARYPIRARNPIRIVSRAAWYPARHGMPTGRGTGGVTASSNFWFIVSSCAHFGNFQPPLPAIFLGSESVPRGTSKLTYYAARLEACTAGGGDCTDRARRGSG